MTFKLPDLPYEYDALEPHISSHTLKVHHTKHHQGYIDKLNKAIESTPYATMKLPEIIRKSKADNDVAVYKNAAQAWNHEFLWRSMSPRGESQPDKQTKRLLADAFGSVDKFKQAFKQCATGQFGSGWAWLVCKDGNLEASSTSNADSPLLDGAIPLLTLDVWEHAYYLDYQNERGKYVDAFLGHMIAWDFLRDNLANAEARQPSSHAA